MNISTAGGALPPVKVLFSKAVVTLLKNNQGNGEINERDTADC